MRYRDRTSSVAVVTPARTTENSLHSSEQLGQAPQPLGHVALLEQRDPLRFTATAYCKGTTTASGDGMFTLAPQTK